MNKEDFFLAEVTKKIAKSLEIDPFRLIGSGAFLLFCNQKYKHEIIDFLKKYAFPISEVGTVISKKEVLIEGVPITPPQADELINGLKSLSMKQNKNRLL